MTRLTIAMLGPFLVTRADGQQAAFEYDKVRALLAYLALEADRPQRREALAGLLWPEQPEKTARGSLRSALATLRQAIGDEDADPPYLSITREAVQFNADSDHTLDVAELTRRLDLAAQHRHRRATTCRPCALWRREAADLYRGPLLAQFSLADSPEFESWLVNAREPLHQRAMANFEQLAGAYLLREDYAAAHFFAGRQLAYEPWHEGAHRQTMLALARKGDRATALRQFQICAQTLDEELGIKPELETVLLFEKIRDKALPQTRFGPIVSAPGLPLIGRERDLSLLARRLADPDARLLTIVGPGGVGKTTLAQAAGRQFGVDFADGSVFVSLVTVTTPDDIFAAIAAALGLLVEPASPIEKQVADYLRPRELLLVLDNFEHLLAGASLLTDLLAVAPRLVLLVTTRQRLNLAAEWLHELAGLDFPVENASDPLADFSAMQLFARRASQERGDFALLSSEAVAAAEICRLVQGMPLAIELAAAATGIQSTAEVARQLRSGLDALAAAWADVPPRHRSIRAAFEQSWAMLTDPERRILRHLSVFSGGFDAAAAEVVAGATPVDLRRLRDKSLLQVREGDRFDLHPLIRAFAAERLAGRAEEAAAMAGYLAYFMALAEKGEREIKARDQLNWLRRLEADHANILAALTWAERNDYTGAARLAAAMWLFWFMRGHLIESRRHYELLYPRRGELPAQLRGRLLNGHTSAMMGQGDMAAIGSVAGEALAYYREAGDDEGIALSLHHLSIEARWRGAFEESEAHLNEGLVAARRVATHSTMSLSVLQDDLTGLWLDMGRFDEARALIHENAALALAEGDHWGWAYALVKLGTISLNTGNLAIARTELEQSLAVAEEYGDRRLIVFCSTYLGEIALRGGDLADAWWRAETAERYSHEVGDRLSRAKALEMQGDILIRRGFPTEAARRFREARDICLVAGDHAAAEKAAEKLAEVANA